MPARHPKMHTIVVVIILIAAVGIVTITVLDYIESREAGPTSTEWMRMFR